MLVNADTRYCRSSADGGDSLAETWFNAMTQRSPTLRIKRLIMSGTGQVRTSCQSLTSKAPRPSNGSSAEAFMTRSGALLNTLRMIPS